MPSILKIDEINKLYDYTDRVIKYITKQNIQIFTEAKASLVNAGGRKVVSVCKDAYAKLTTVAVNGYLRIAKDVIRRFGGKPIGPGWIDELLDEPDDVTGYKFFSEAERKEGRTVENIIAFPDTFAVTDKALRDWNKMTNQYAVNITDYALLKSYEDNGVEFVKWVTVKDERLCEECRELDGKIFPIKEVPPKPHWNCRCRLVGWTKN